MAIMIFLGRVTTVDTDLACFVAGAQKQRQTLSIGPS
jgi:hypothetical protein